MGEKEEEEDDDDDDDPVSAFISLIVGGFLIGTLIGSIAFVIAYRKALARRRDR